MTLLTAADKAQMICDLAEVVADRPVSITIRRGSSSLDAQTVRVARLGQGQGRAQQSEAAEEQRAAVVVVGSTTFDVQVDDRFNAGGILYQVTFVRPHQDAAIIAEGEAVQ